MVSGCEPIVHEIEGRVVDSAGKGIEGVMVSAIDDEHRKWISVFSQKDGSFSVSGLRDVDHNIRTPDDGVCRWMGKSRRGRNQRPSH